MARKYKNPPLLEALCEFRFTPSGLWDWTIPGLFFDKVKNEFPQKRQQNVIELTLEQGSELIKQDVKGGVARMQFLRNDGTALVQVGPNNLVVNQLRPYPNWGTFRKMTLAHLESYCKIANPGPLVRIGLRYINRVSIPGIPGTAPDGKAFGIELDDFFRSAPKLPAPIPQFFGSFIVSVDVEYPSPRMILRFIFTRVDPEKTDGAHFMLDLDIGTAPDHLPAGDGVGDWLNSAHERLEAAFDAAFTERTHVGIFEEIK